jgi:hypothetical protein
VRSKNGRSTKLRELPVINARQESGKNAGEAVEV